MLSLRIALRYLFARKSHNAVNIISLVSMAGIAVAAMAMICVMSVFNGFTDVAASRLSMIDPQVRVTGADGSVISNADSVVEAVMKVGGVRAAMPSLSGQALAVFDNKQLPVMIQGIPDGYEEVSEIGSTVIDGEIRRPDMRGRYTTLSVGLAVALGARPSYSSVITVMTPRRKGNINPALPLSAFRSDTLTVSGVYQSDQAEYDVDRMILPLEDARRLLDYTTEATSVDIALSPGVSEKDAVTRLAALLGPGYKVSDRMAQQETSFRMIEIEKWVTFLMMTFILLMASFNILSTMSMLIIEKRRSITILSALGAPSGMIRRIFLNQGFLIAAVGGMAGIAIGIILVLAQQHFGFITLGGDHSIMSIDTYPVRLALTDIFAVVAIVAFTGIATGAISSAKAVNNA